MFSPPWKCEIKDEEEEEPEGEAEEACVFFWIIIFFWGAGFQHPCIEKPFFSQLSNPRRFVDVLSARALVIWKIPLHLSNSASFIFGSLLRTLQSEQWSPQGTSVEVVKCLLSKTHRGFGRRTWSSRCIRIGWGSGGVWDGGALGGN